MTTHPQPILSIIIVAYKSLTDLQRCLPSLSTAGLNAFSHEIIIVDNYGQDGVERWLSATFPDVKYYLNEANSGYPGGNNVGIARARGQWTLLLNPDTELLPNCLTQLMETAQAHPQALINPKVLNPDGTINACGNQMHYTGITTCRGLNEPSSAFTTLETIPLLSGAALLAPASILRQLGGFEEEYFMYFEDTDLSLRARLLGYPLLCDARAELVHHYKLGMNPAKFGYLERNRLVTLLKVLSKKTIWHLLPALILTELITWAFALRGLDYLRNRWWGYHWLWKNRKWLNAQHQQIQKSRVVSDRDLLSDSLSVLPFGQLVNGTLGRTLNKIMYFIYRGLRPRSLRASYIKGSINREEGVRTFVR